jgi:Fe-S cluster assembly iron-binding protein IscA
MKDQPENMFLITDSAADQFIKSPVALGDDNLRLRISAKKSSSGAMAYNVGFRLPVEIETRYQISGIKVILDPDSI